MLHDENNGVRQNRVTPNRSSSGAFARAPKGAECVVSESPMNPLSADALPGIVGRPSGGGASVVSRGRSAAGRSLRAVCIVGAIVTAAGSAPASAARTPTPGSLAPDSTVTAAAPPMWQTAWTSAMDFYEGTAVNASARDIAPMAVGGTSVEFRLSNAWSGTPTTFGAVTVGVQQSGASVVPGSTVPITFNDGSREITIPAGKYATSDPISFPVHAGESLAVSVWVEGTGTVSVHYCCSGRTDSYATLNGAGNQTLDEAGTSLTLASTHMRWLSAIEVSRTPAQGTVVAFGDSITDGFNDDGQGWPTPLQQRIALLPPSQQVSVVNQGITGNTLTVFPSAPPNLTYALTSGGLPGVTRLSSDVLSLPGTRDVVLFLGTNDIWFGGRLSPGLPYGTSASIISAMQSVITQVHADGMRIFGVTLLPRTTSPPGPGEEVWTTADQSNLEQVNAWIRSSSSGFDGVIDLASVVADVYNGQCDPTALFGPYNSGDNLHPSEAGELAMADAIPTPLFQVPEAPQLPQAITATPTPGCAGAVKAEQALTLAQTPSTSTTTPTTSASARPKPPTHRVVPHKDRGSTVVDAVIGVAIVVLLGVAVLIVLWRRTTRKRRTRGRGVGGTPVNGGRPAHLRRSARR